MSKLPQLTFRIAKIWGSSQGTVEKHDLYQKISYPEESSLQFTSNFRAELMFIKLKDEICAIINEAKIDLKATCQLCLKPFILTISIPSAEREFLHDKPYTIEDPADLFLINLKAMTIDLSELVRQEIILHFPLIPVCSKSCKGLCMHCNQNRNLKKCACKGKEEDTYKPFKDLKKILKNS